MMRTRITSRLLACVGIQLLLLAGTNLANTVDIVQDGYGAHDSTYVWGGGLTGTEVATGMYLLNKTGDTGTGGTWRNGLIPGFCVELEEVAPQESTRYSVGMPEDMYSRTLGTTLGVEKGNYLRELWARYYDPAWVTNSMYIEDNRRAEAFGAAVWEIIYEDLPSSLSRWDVTVDGTPGLAGFRAENLDWETANTWLSSLTGGPKADLRVFTNDGGQNFLVAVPEPATVALLGLGGLALIRRRRPQTD